ncbi:MAG TPA: amidohydrolase family protein [Lachnospiraceae bacterium]|nr:amidohydrolase family protein [Lachnospiraceae bacterium]
MMIIDSHAHVMQPVELQIEKMQKGGVDRTILISTTPHVEKASNLTELEEEMQSLYHILGGKVSPDQRIADMKRSIIELQTTVRKYPDYFLGFAPMPIGLDIANARDWMEQQVIGNGFRGIGEFTPGTTEQMQALEVVFEVLKENPGYPIWIHTFQPVSQQGIDILMNLTRKYATVPTIWGHMGGYHWMQVIKFAKDQPNVYLDLSACFCTLAARIAMVELPSRCLFASDAPFGEPLLSRQLIEYMSPNSRTTDLVLGENISRLLKL